MDVEFVFKPSLDVRGHLAEVPIIRIVFLRVRAVSIKGYEMITTSVKTKMCRTKIVTEEIFTEPRVARREVLSAGASNLIVTYRVIYLHRQVLH